MGRSVKANRLVVGCILLFSVLLVTCENPLTNLVKRPKISLSQGTTPLSNAESFDFGTVAVSDSKDVVFTIENKGTTALNLTNMPRIVITGSTAFTVLVQPPATVAAGSTESFTVRFTPQDTTLQGATLTVKSDDPETGTYVVSLSGKGSTSGTLTDAQSVAADKASLQITYASGDSTTSVTGNLTLPNSGLNGTTISWSSDTPGAISNAGVVVRPAAGTTNATVVLTATILKGTTSDTKQFTLTVVKNPVGDAQCVADDKAGLQITFAGGDSISRVTQNLTLPTAGSSGTSISWASDITSIVSVAGVLMRPASTTVVTMTATITKGAANDSKVFAVTVIMAAPAVPGSLIAQATSASAIHLSWTDASTNESGFKVERSPDGSSGWNQVHLTAANATSWDDAGLSSATTYFYRVRSTNAGGDSAYANTASATTDQVPPAAPTGLSASALSLVSIRLTWTDNSTNETGFKIERSPDSATGWTQLATVGVNAITYDDAGLNVATIYYYRIRATNAAGDSPTYSNISFATTETLRTINVVTINSAGDSFTMGDGTYGPNVSESLSYNFTMSKYEITNSQFAQFIADGGYTTQSYWTTSGWAWKGSTTQPDYWTDSNFNGDNQPVVGVSWYEAVAFCNWRSVKEGLTAAYNSSGLANLSATGYRLPTEVEWEYAAAKGASGQAERIYAWGDTWDSSKAVCSVSPTSASKTANVGSKSAAGGDTPQGLADMSGNVWEWCSDNYGSVAVGTDRYYFLNDSMGQTFLLHSGAWNLTNEFNFRCAHRDYGDVPYLRVSVIGFRVARYVNYQIQWPAAPTGLSAPTVFISQIHLTWTDNSNNETGFKIERSPDGTSGWTQVKLTAANTTSWNDTALSAGTTYYYRVRATNAAGDSPYSNTVSTATLASFAGGVTIYAAGDSFTIGDGTYGPNVSESLSYNFTMSKYEITNAQFLQFIFDGGYTTQGYWTTNGWAWKGYTTQPAYWTDSNFNVYNQPVVGVSWYEAVAFCNWWSAKEGLVAAYDSAGHATLSASGYRLPTEVEWEYAAAKGGSGQTERIFAWGDAWDSSKAVCSVSPAIATKTADVGSKSTGNSTTTGDTLQGLADMSGNVLEWCSDNYQSDASVASGTDRYYFVDDSTSKFPVVRGGAWNYTFESGFRCVWRSSGLPYDRDSLHGFRVARP